MTAGWLPIPRLLGVLALALASACGGTPDGVPEQVGFNQHIRPILSDKCFPCHGPDGNKRQAELRLDVRDSALAERKGTPAIAPGDAAASELVRRIRSTDPDYRMPPPRSNRTLNPHEIALLERWVEQGAAYEPHWAYIPVRRPVPPAVQDPRWSENPIDQFVRAQLDAQGIAPSPDADPHTLARRLSFDLVGLPPKPEDVTALVQEGTPAAFTALVDRLLASPHYGERMAVYWLDLVRFADTNGYNEDQHRNIYPYRDYVIRAFNDNMPFDQFTIEQLAGDLLPAPTVSQRVASGYNRLNKVSTENGSQAKEFLAKYAADRVRTTATVWMGATLGCAECHDHKFDPYTAEDFYRFAAFFADIEAQAIPTLGRISQPPEAVVPPAEKDVVLEQLNRQLKELHGQRSALLDQQRERFEAAFRAWGRSAAKPSAAIVSTEPPFVLARWTPILTGGTIDKSGWLRVASPPAGAGVMRIVRPGPGDLEFLLDIGALGFPDGSPNQMEGFAWKLHHGTGGLTISVSRSHGEAINLKASANPGDMRIVEVGTPDDLKSLSLRALWSASKKQWSASYGINGTPPRTPFPGGPLSDPVLGEHEGWRESIQVISISLAQLDEPNLQPPPGPAVSLEALLARHVIRRYDPLADPPAEIEAIRAIPQADRSAAQSQALVDYYVSVAPQLAAVNGEIDRVQAQKQALEALLPRTLVTVAAEPRVTRILHRGDWQDESGKIVEPAIPAFLRQGGNEEAENRLTLARWLVSPENPLTARVLVNRLWKLFFGHGIVRTLDDLGSQATRPSHPELLDWLAAELIESGWDVKHVVRLLVTSRTYRQSSTERPDLREIDPDNQLLARQSSFRLDAEMIRDNALAISGLLSPQIGGPSTKPYQPQHYWQRVSKVIPGSPAANWIPSPGAEQYRRGLYTYWKRTFLHPSLVTFDAPTREECVAERPRSNTPLQALVLLNDPTYVEAARVLAERAARSGGAAPDAQIRWAYRQTLSRDAESEALTILRSVFDKHLAEYRAEPESAGALAKVGFAKAAKASNGRADHLAALTSVCRVLLNLSETITRY